MLGSKQPSSHSILKCESGPAAAASDGKHLQRASTCPIRCLLPDTAQASQRDAELRQHNLSLNDCLPEGRKGSAAQQGPLLRLHPQAGDMFRPRLPAPAHQKFRVEKAVQQTAPASTELRQLIRHRRRRRRRPGSRRIRSRRPASVEASPESPPQFGFHSGYTRTGGYGCCHGYQQGGGLTPSQQQPVARVSLAQRGRCRRRRRHRRRSVHQQQQPHQHRYFQHPQPPSCDLPGSPAETPSCDDTTVDVGNSCATNVCTVFLVVVNVLAICSPYCCSCLAFCLCGATSCWSPCTRQLYRSRTASASSSTPLSARPTLTPGNSLATCVLDDAGWGGLPGPGSGCHGDRLLRLLPGLLLQEEAKEALIAAGAKAGMEYTLTKFTGIDCSNLESLLINLMQIFVGCCGVTNGTDFYSLSSNWNREYTLKTSSGTSPTFNLTSMEQIDNYCSYNNTNSVTSWYQTGCHDKLITKLESMLNFKAFVIGIVCILLTEANWQSGSVTGGSKHPVMRQLRNQAEYHNRDSHKAITAIEQKTTEMLIATQQLL
uniref:Tetraspanin n=1 Tax=Macrostomum lignano TaxID=282301 RepID=A0A1I8F7H7_9PLAT